MQVEVIRGIRLEIAHRDPEREQLAVLMVSFDTERDTVAVLKATADTSTVVLVVDDTSSVGARIAGTEEIGIVSCSVPA